MDTVRELLAELSTTDPDLAHRLRKAILLMVAEVAAGTVIGWTANPKG